MDFISGGNGSGDEVSSGSGKGKRQIYRHSAKQIEQLEGFFKDCPHPDEYQREELANALELAPRQVKFWFQNRRTQMKTQTERMDNNALKSENEKLYLENMALRGALMNPSCQNCDGLSLNLIADEEAKKEYMQNLLIENARLKEEYQRLLSILGTFPGRPGM